MASGAFALLLYLAAHIGVAIGATTGRGCPEMVGGDGYAPALVRVNSQSPYEERYGFSRAVRVGDRVFVAGTAPIPAEGSEPAATPYEQTLRCGEIIEWALTQTGASMGDVVRTRIYITDSSFADEVGRAHAELFGAASPAATMVVTGLLDSGWLVEVEAEAIVA